MAPREEPISNKKAIDAFLDTLAPRDEDWRTVAINEEDKTGIMAIVKDGDIIVKDHGILQMQVTGGGHIQYKQTLFLNGEQQETETVNKALSDFDNESIQQILRKKNVITSDTPYISGSGPGSMEETHKPNTLKQVLGIIK